MRVAVAGVADVVTGGEAVDGGNFGSRGQTVTRATGSESSRQAEKGSCRRLVVGRSVRSENIRSK